MIDQEYREFLEFHLPKLKKHRLSLWQRFKYKNPNGGSTKHDTLRYCLGQLKIAPEDGLIAEFGVWKGGTIRMIAGAYPSSRIFGFDSFEGFPEDGRTDWQQDFSLDGKMPVVPGNVTLIKGYFEDTLPEFVEKYGAERLALLHIDCDLYSSTKTIFNLCRSMIRPGCIIIFDELLHYDRFLQNEMLAFYEFIQETGLGFEWIAIRDKVLSIQDFLNPTKSIPRQLVREESHKIWRQHGYEQEVALRIVARTS